MYTKVGRNESVVRVLFPNKVLNGRVLGAAFVLRGHREERSVSVFRQTGPTFVRDLQALDGGRNLPCAVMSVGMIDDVRLNYGGNTACCEVVATGRLEETSHAGIVVSVNGQPMIGGHEDEIVLDSEPGVSMSVIALAVQHRLAAIAQGGLTRVNEVC